MACDNIIVENFVCCQSSLDNNTVIMCIFVFNVSFISSVSSSQTVRETSLLCELCNSLQSCEESLKGKQKNQGPTSKVPTQGKAEKKFSFTTTVGYAKAILPNTF